MEQYFDEMTAELYDLQYDFTSGDIDFYKRLSSEAEGPVLELACGTGRVLLPILEAGYPIEGLDYSAPMLAVLERKLEERDLDTTLYHQSMLDFKIDKQYALIQLPFSSFLILNSLEDQIRCLENCRDHLAPGGRMALDFFINSPVLCVSQDGTRRLCREIINGEQSILLFETVTNDYNRQLKNITYFYETYTAGGNLERTFMRKLQLRWVHVDEFKLMAKVAGFSNCTLFGGFDGQPVTGDSRRLVAILER